MDVMLSLPFLCTPSLSSIQSGLTWPTEGGVWVHTFEDHYTAELRQKFCCTPARRRICLPPQIPPTATGCQPPCSSWAQLHGTQAAYLQADAKADKHAADLRLLIHRAKCCCAQALLRGSISRQVLHPHDMGRCSCQVQGGPDF